MSISIAARFALASAALGVAAGCAGGSQVAPTPAAPVSSTDIGRSVGSGAFLSPSGRLFRSGPHARVPAARPLVRYPKNPKDLYVALSSDVLVLQNKTWQQVGTITAGGMACPDGDWVDRKGNLYVAAWNCGGSNTPGVYEFKRGASQPSFVYTTGLNDPINVETDHKGNVYVMDFEGGYLDEYKQGNNSLLYQCAAPDPSYGLVESAAIDRHGNVFVASVNGQIPYSTELYEYVGGLKGCSATQLATFPFFPGGMVLDKNENLILVDQVDDVVDVIPPPYSAIGSQISAIDPFMVTINKKNDQIYVSSTLDGDESTGAVFVDTYPSGANLATLGVSNGISSDVGGVADALNYVP